MFAVLFAVVAVAVLACAGAASAITYGQPDGDRHPNVGALVGEFDGGRYPYCSGTLVSPTVFLTAAHCDISEERVSVTFDSEYSAGSTLYAGTFYGHPRYPGPTSNPYDIAVVVFDEPVAGIEPAELPTLNQFRRLPKNQKFTSVGYGAPFERGYPRPPAPRRRVRRWRGRKTGRRCLLTTGDGRRSGSGALPAPAG